MTTTMGNNIFRTWSKSVILHAPTLRDTSVDMQEEVDDILPQLNRDGPKCVIYNLSFSRLFNKWASKEDSSRAESLR